jgi:hypothetical protein
MSENNIKDNNGSKESFSIKDKYEILIKARNFHYENFNKWMSYFYVMIASIILGFSYIISKDVEYADKYIVELEILGSIGFTISLLWHWANKGYYYWNINFITLVNYYEEKLLQFAPTERIYFVFANKKSQNSYGNIISGANISTSKISILLSYLFAVFFGTYVSSRLLSECIICKQILFPVSILISVATIFILSNTVARHYLYSKIDHFEDLKIEPQKIHND